ncbi:hypothetical protein MELA_01846 [Candidatus Methylomirabilis lanthanidiphila]|uniref:DUF2007 domain-containing protein n=1 Tax=Candidatus Methylomirabilis lanthanidiphila TaxID=2211376 RepID=A0A564ZJE2_9BACT|nr:DUF2007 domain-containing protein [Candidatus Methylomirabilis lanthanidiphila]VUZ85461.1 hypothetical protein MELA_01846 [Candidatus Methylomirabilis lanthanidiphila]
MHERIIYATYDEMLAELLRLHLERHGVPCWLRSMRVGGFHGITFGPLGEIRLMTSRPYAAKGRRLIEQVVLRGALSPVPGNVGQPE